MNQITNAPQDDFIMRPTNDVCFCGLMENPVVRKYFCAAILRVPPEKIKWTELLPTHLRRDHANDKLRILDVRVHLQDRSQINMEMQVKEFEYWDERVLFYLSKMYFGQLKSGETYKNLKRCIQVSILDFIHFPGDNRCYRTIHFRDDETGELYSNKLELQVLELKKLPPEVKTEKDIVRWMRFLNGKNRKEFENMAKTSEDMGIAYETLLKLSADDKKRIEYEAREKALKDYNSQISSAERRGEKRGEKRGEQRGQKKGIYLARRVFKMYLQGATNEQIVSECHISVEKVRDILI